jgi:hypothetical protein
MPEISRFFGIVIRMYYNDHAPPHFHAEYGSHEAQIRIDPLGCCTASYRRGHWRSLWNGRPSIAKSF